MSRWTMLGLAGLLVVSGPASAQYIGITCSKKTFILDLPGKWESFAKIGDRNGNDIIEGTFRMRYNATRATAGQIIIVNALSSLP